MALAQLEPTTAFGFSQIANQWLSLGAQPSSNANPENVCFYHGHPKKRSVA